MEFTTQAELLEYLGKNPNDRNLVQRMIIRGEVEKRDWMYVLINKDEIIKELRERIFFLEKERDENAALNDNKKLKADLMEAKIQWDYWESKARKYSQYCADIIWVCYRKIKQVMWSRFTEDEETFREGISNMVKEPTEE